MSKTSENAVALHQQGFNCAQSVLCALCDKVGLDETTARAVAGGFGGGLRCGEICGAISGAVMALGMACPFIDGEDTGRKVEIAELTKDLVACFRKEFGSLCCAELLRAAGGKGRCDEYITLGVRRAEQLIAEC